MSMLEQIKTLREKTGAGVVDVKKALEESGDDEQTALDILRKRGKDRAVKKADRVAGEGVIATYIHSNNKIGAMVRVLCETDFVARTPQFQSLARDVAMHIAAADPRVMRPEDISDDVIAKERDIWIEQCKAEGKPEKIIETIIAGKEKKFREEQSLLTQPFVKDPERTVGDLLAENVSAMGENIQIGGFVRYEI